MYNIDLIKKDMKKSLSEYRYYHCLRVADEAKKLACRYGIDEENAYVAGLMHDIAKEFSEEENNYWIKNKHISLELLGDEYKKVIHAEVGSIIAKDKYQMNNEICQAIKYHTIGNINMNLLDKIIYVADKIENGKNYPGIEEERIVAYKDIDKCLILCLENQKKKVENQGRIFLKKSSDLLEYLKKK